MGVLSSPAMAPTTSSPDNLPPVPNLASPDEAVHSSNAGGGGVEEISTSSLVMEDGGLPNAPAPPVPGIPTPPGPDETTPFEEFEPPPIEATMMISAMADEPSFEMPEPEHLLPSAAADVSAKSDPEPFSSTVMMDALPRGPRDSKRPKPSVPTAAIPQKKAEPARPVDPAPEREPFEATRMMAALPDPAASNSAPLVVSGQADEPLEATRMLSAMPDDLLAGVVAEAADEPFEATVMISALGAAIDAVNSAPEELPGRDLSGDLIGERYRLLQPLGKGAVGVVYKAEHTLMKKPVAVKVLHPATSRHPSVTQRFVAEARALAQIAHRHVCAATDFGQTDDGEFYLVMEFLEGRTLAELMSVEGRVAPDRAVFIVEQMCAGLAACHKLGIVHRDLKPENVMLVEADGYPDCVKLFDFGIAHVSRAESAGTREAVMGTVEYMAPEQALGDAVDARTDLYSLGVMLFELLTGRLPFEDGDPLEVLRRHIEQTPPSLSVVAPDAGIPPLLEEVVTQLLAKRPADRVQTAEELKARLGRVWAVGGGPTASGGFWQRLSMPIKAALVGVPVLALVLGLAFSGGDSDQSAEPTDDGGGVAITTGDGDEDKPAQGSSKDGDKVAGETPDETPEDTPTNGGEKKASVKKGVGAATAIPVKQADAAGADSGGSSDTPVATAPDVSAGPDVLKKADVGTAKATDTTVGAVPVAAVPVPTPAVVAGAPLTPEVAVAALPDADVALANLKNGNATAALGQLQALLSTHPKNPHLHYLIAKASSATSNDIQALTSYAKAIELEPRYAQDPNLVDTVFAFIDLPDDPITAAGLKLLSSVLAPYQTSRLAKVAISSGRAQSRERAAKILKDSGSMVKLEAWQRDAIALRGATSCETRKPHVLSLGALGNKAALQLLSTMAGSRRGCGATGADDCHACMRVELDAIVVALGKK